MKTVLALLVAGTALGVAATWPLAAQLGTALAAGGDAFVHVWDFWWTARAVPPGPPGLFFTPLQFHPNGTTLLLHTLCPALAVPGAALAALTGAPEAVNVVLLATYPLAALCAWLFARAAGCGPAAAAGAALLYAMSPFHHAHAQGGHLGLAAVHALPLFGAALLWALRSPRAGPALLSGAAWSLAGFTHPYFAVYCALFAPAAVLLFRGTREAWLRRLGAAALGAAPLLVLLGAGVAAALRTRFLGAHDPTEYSGDLLAYFVPTTVLRLGEHPALRALSERWSGNAVEQTLYFGWTLLALAALGAVRAPAARRWLVLAAAFWLLSLGNRLHVNGSVVRPAVLPYAALTRLVPPLQWGGVPSRFHGITLLCLIYPAAVGLTWLGRRGALAAALALAETAPAPFPMVALPRFPALEALEALPPGAAVVDATGDEYRMLFRQTIHGRPMAGGHVSRVPEPADRFIRETPWLTFLLAGGPPPAGDGAAELRRLGFGAVIVEEDEGLDREAVRATWRRRGFEELTGAVLDALSVVRRQTAEELRAELAERRPEPAARVPRDLLEWTVAESNRRLVRDHLERTLGWRPAAIDSLVCVYRLP